MIDDVITLVKPTDGEHVKDNVGNQIRKVPLVRRQVFCGVESTMRSEFYQAAQTGLHPEYIFTLTHFKDWQGETVVEYTDWTGETKTYDVVRTYRVPDTDRLELTVQERIANYGKP